MDIIYLMRLCSNYMAAYKLSDYNIVLFNHFLHGNLVRNCTFVFYHTDSTSIVIDMLHFSLFVGVHTSTAFDEMRNDSIKDGFSATIKPTSPAAILYATVGVGPYVGMFYAVEVGCRNNHGLCKPDIPTFH